MKRSFAWSALTLAVTLAGCSAAPETETEAVSSDAEALGAHHGGAVFTISNALTGNSVLAFRRARDGSLSPAGEFSTAGLGAGASLGSQGALALSEDHRLLVAVNAGSNDISAFRVEGTKLTLLDRVSSGGVRPVSVAIHDRFVYVVNAGEPAMVAGFRVRANGSLKPLPDASQPLSAAAPGAAQIGIAPHGDRVVVSEKTTNVLDSFRMLDDGSLEPATVSPSAGTTPFGFAFTPRGHLIVSEAASGSVSSYRLDRRGGITPISAAVPDLQRAPCWVATTRDSRFAYTANAGSASISGYRVARDGALSLLDANGVTGDAGASSRPLDMAIDDAQEHLYLLDAGNHAISEFDIGEDGELTLRTSVAGLALTAAGVAAY